MSLMKLLLAFGGNGGDRKNALTEAGYDYNAVQARVNQLL